VEWSGEAEDDSKQMTEEKLANHPKHVRGSGARRPTPAFYFNAQYGKSLSLSPRDRSTAIHYPLGSAAAISNSSILE